MSAGAIVMPQAGPLPRGQKLALAAEIVVAYGRTRWSLRRSDLRGALADLRAPGATPARDVDSTRTGLRLGRAVVRTLALLPTDSRCLMRSLVLTNLLARRGIESRLVLGVRPGEGFAAHAWVEHGSAPLLDPGENEFQRLAAL